MIFKQILPIVVVGEPGEMVWDSAKRALAAARATGKVHKLVFNGTSVNVYPGSLAEDIFEKWSYLRTAEQAA